MNQKNSLGLNICFKDKDNPIELFKEWFEEAKNSEINDPNALALATTDKKGQSSVRMVLLKDFDNNGFVFYTNFDSDKSKAIKENPNVSMCFHWKSLLRQVRIVGTTTQVSEKEADDYFESRAYESKIGAWSSDQSSILNKRQDLLESFKKYKNRFRDQNKVPRPKHWSGWRLKPKEIEFWLNRENRLHERLKYFIKEKNWEKVMLNP
tara:strand:+ start:54 stop:677 length:624 start_codon:yes stop_codon:yes gene_type:complete